MDNVSKIGRPTKYKEEYCKSIVDYFNIPPFTTMYKREYYKDGTIKTETPILVANKLPTFQGYANSIEVHIDTLNEWKNNIASFSEAYARAKTIQEDIWLTNGMQNLYNSQFAQFFGKNCLGYKDKVDIDIGAIQAQPDPEQLEASIQNLLSKLPEAERQKLLGSG